MTRIPIQLQEWAVRWEIPPTALADLLQLMDIATPAVAHQPDSRTSEAYVQSLVRLEAPRYGVQLWRNNVGARTFIDDDGQKRHLRWGLANDSPAVNAVFKSADLIGWRSITIEPHLVGARFAQFVSRECKEVSWTWSGTDREPAQLNWLMKVTEAGGDARFVTGEGSFE